MILSVVLVCSSEASDVTPAAEPPAGEYDATANLDRLEIAFEKLEQADVKTILQLRVVSLLMYAATVGFLLYAGYRLVEYCGPNVGSDSERRDHSWIVLVLFLFLLCYAPLSWVLAGLVGCWVSKVFAHLRSTQGDISECSERRT
jgi:hypothetical protein